MESFRKDGCLSDEGLHALIAGQLDELGRLEAAEHLAYCDKCTDRYTALLTADALSDPPRSVRRTVMGTIWVRLMQSTCGRAAKLLPEKLGRPVDSRPGENFYTRVSSALESLLNAAENIK